MTERYDVAAERHYDVADQLQCAGETDDAAYHYGLVGENALKHALRTSGVAAHWHASGLRRRDTPMGKHLPDLTSFVLQFTQDISTYATGRIAGELNAVVSDPQFASRFAGWSIDIRYADTRFTPVAPADCDAWQADADHLLRKLVLMT